MPWFNIHNDILRDMDQRNVTLLVLLDLSAAFDTANHKILLRLRTDFGVEAKAHICFQSYLKYGEQQLEDQRRYSIM